MTERRKAVLTPDDPLLEVPISAIEHYSYCPRQCALIHVEQTFEENLFTIRGHLAHERVDSEPESSSRGIKTYRSLPIWSDRLGLRGRADAVEMHGVTPFPVEYKVGRRRGNHAEFQVCAQALCLEEMMDVAVPRGALFFFAERRRYPVEFNHTLRDQTLEIIAQIRQDLAEQRVPPAVNDARCRRCSLVDSCMPSVVAEQNRLRGLQGSLFQPLTEA